MARPREFNKDEVLARALQVFWTNGYKSTSLKDLVFQLGVNRASLYNTYGNKRNFFAAALEHYKKTRLPFLIDPLKGDSAVEAKLHAFYRRMIELGGQKNMFRGCFVLGTMHELARLEPRLAKLCTDTVSALEKEIHAVIKDGQKRKEIRDDISAKELTTIVVSTGIGLMAKARVKVPARELQKAVQSTLRLLHSKPIFGDTVH